MLKNLFAIAANKTINFVWYQAYKEGCKSCWLSSGLKNGNSSQKTMLNSLMNADISLFYISHICDSKN